MIDIDKIYKELKLDKDKIINIYRYGSQVYGTNTSNSDEDFIIIYNQKDFKIDTISNNNGSINATLYSLAGFKNDIYYQHISVLECLWLPNQFKIESIPMRSYYKLDLINLRKSISSVASNSWVKCKKKMWQGDILLGQKSLFHALRIFDFGIQIAKYGRIVDYKRDFKNFLFKIKQYNNWQELKDMFQPEFNKLHSEFKKLTVK